MGRSGPGILAVACRRRLFDCVEANQGLHLRELSRRTMVPLGTALYHLDRLVSFGLVTERRDGRYRRYFAGGSLGVAEKEMVSAFRHAVPRRIADILLQAGVATQRDLCARLGVSRSTVSLHLGHLVALGILRCERVPPENRYRLADSAFVARVLETHGASLGSASVPVLATLDVAEAAASAGGP